jgi:hypothetical protein
VPPVAVIGLEYPVPTVPDGSDAEIVKVAGAGAATTSESLTDWVCAGLPASVTVAVKLVVPLAVGVPEIRPVLVARLRPAGKLPALIDHV